MAKRNNTPPTSEDRVETIYYDSEGNRILGLGFIRREREEDGVEITETQAENVLCGDNRMYNTSLAMRTGQDRVLLAACDACVEESRSLLSSKRGTKMVMSFENRMARCEKCRAMLCERHFVVKDGIVRCKRCANRHYWTSLFCRILSLICFKHE